jgi:hypothetical protein
MRCDIIARASNEASLGVRCSHPQALTPTTDGDHENACERFSLTSSKPFDTILSALKAAIGCAEIAEFLKATTSAKSLAELESLVSGSLGRLGLMLLMELDLGAFLRFDSRRKALRIVRLIVSNPLIRSRWSSTFPMLDRMRRSMSALMECTRHTTRWKRLLAPYGNQVALTVARTLDAS